MALAPCTCGRDNRVSALSSRTHGARAGAPASIASWALSPGLERDSLAGDPGRHKEKHMWLLRVLQRRQLVRVSQSLCPRPTGSFLRLGTLSQGRLGCHRMGVKGGFLGMLNMTSPDQLQFCLNLQPEGLQVPKNHQGLTRECSGAWGGGAGHQSQVLCHWSHIPDP